MQTRVFSPGFVLCYPAFKSRQTGFPSAPRKVSEVSLKLEKGEDRMMQAGAEEGTLAKGILIRQLAGEEVVMEAFREAGGG